MANLVELASLDIRLEVRAADSAGFGKPVYIDWSDIRICLVRNIRILQIEVALCVHGLAVGLH
jgi:hypothetical protein